MLKEKNLLSLIYFCRIYLYLQYVTQKIQYFMNRISLKLYLLFVFVFFFGNKYTHAQVIGDYESLTMNDYLSLTLPPLDVLFENAKNAPTYELAQVLEMVERKNLSKEKRAFLSFFSIRGSYQYGTFTNDGSFSDVNQPLYNSYTKNSQNMYSVGAGVNIPLDELFDLGARVKRQKLIVRSQELMKEQKLEEVKKEIIILYNAAIAQLNILKLRAESLVLANVEYSIVEKNFANGTVTSKELAMEKERQSVSKEKYETSRTELSKSLMMLELITQTPIIRK